MFRFYLRQLFKTFFPRSRRSRRAVRKAPVPYRPYVEPLEDRWMPAIQLTYAGTGGALSLDEVTAAASDNITISELTTGTLTIDLNGATFDAGSTTAASGLNYQMAGDPANSTFATIDISSANAITSLSANLGDNNDTLAIGFSQGVGDVSLDGGNGNDAVTLNATTAGGSLSINATVESTTLDGNVTTGSDQFYGGAVTLGAAVSLTANNNGAITFNQTVDGNFALTVNTGGNTSFNGAVGNGTALSSLSTDAAGNTAINGGIVTTAGAQSYGDNVILGANTNLTSTGSGDISFDQTLDGASNLTVNTGGNTSFGGAVGNTTPLVSVTTDAPGNTVLSGGSIKTTGDQTFNDPVILTADTTLTDSGTGLFFNSTVDGDGNGPWNLTTVTSNATSQIRFNGIVGGTNPLKALTVDDAGTGSANAAIAGNATTFTKDGNGTFTLAATNTYTGNTTVNAGTLFVDGATDANSAFTVNNGTLAGNGTVGGNVTVNSGGQVAPGDSPGTLSTGTISFTTGAAFDEEISSATPGNFDQLDVTGNVTLGNATLNITAFGNTTINPGDEFVIIANDGNDAVSGTFVAGTGVNATAGTPLPEGALLSNDFLGSDHKAFITYQGGDGNDVAILIQGTADFNGTNGDDMLEIRRVTGGGTDSIQFLNNGTMIDSRPFASVDNITVNGLGGNDTLTVNFNGTGGFFNQPVTFHGGNATTASGNDTLVVKGGSFALGISNYTGTGPAHNGTLTFDQDGNLATTADRSTVSYDGLAPMDISNVTIADLVLVLPNTDDDAVLQDEGTQGNNIVQLISTSGTFENTTFSNPTNSLTILLGDGNDTLTIASGAVAPDDLTAGLTIDGQNGTDTVNFNGALSLSTGAGNLDVTVEAINLNNGVTTSAGQNYNGPVQLGANVTLASTNNGAISFAQTVGGGFALTANTGGNTSFNGVVGGTTPLSSLTTDAPGNTTIGANITTTGNQTFNDNVTLTGNATLTSTGNADISFAKTLDGAFALAVNTGGNTTFKGAVGNTTPLVSLSTDGPGNTAINGGIVTTTGAQNYGDNVTLGAATILTSTGNGTISFARTLDGSVGLTVNTGGNTIFNGAVGNTTPLVSLTTDAPGNTAINGGNVTTTGSQTYGDNVTLGANTTLTSNANGAISFGKTLDGNFTLAVNTGGNTTFNGAVGSMTPLMSLTTDAPGTTDINGGTVTTTGNQTYLDPVVLTANTTLNGSNITFNSTVDSDSTATPRSLTVNSSGNGTTLFNGVVGGNAALASLTTNADGTTDLNNGNSAVTVVNTTGDQTYNDAVLLTVNTTLNGRNITFAGTLNSSGVRQNLTVNANAAAGGSLLFGAPVGNTLPLNTLRIGNAFNVSFNNVFTATNIIQVAGTGTTAVNSGPLTVDGVVGIDITTNAIVLAANVTASAASAIVRLNPTVGGVMQTGGALVAPNLLLTGNGMFMLNQTGNNITTLAASVSGKVSFRDANAITVGTISGVNGITTNNNDLCLDSGAGTLSIIQPINVGNATVRLRSQAGIMQSGAGTITASTLGIQAGGAVSLGLGNSLATFAAQAGADLTFNDIASLTISTVSADPSCGFTGASGIITPGQITVNSNGSLTLAPGIVVQGTRAVLTAGTTITVNPGAAINASTIILNSGTDLTLAQGSTLNAGSGTITANAGQANVVATVSVLGNLQGASATFNGSNASTGAGQGDTFKIRPSENTPITVNGFQPGALPGDSLSLFTDGAQVTSFTANADGQGPASKSGSFQFANRRQLSFTGIESAQQINISVISVQTSPATFQLFASLNFNATPLGARLNVQSVVSIPFLLAPNGTNPFQPPFGTPQVAVADVNGDGISDVVVGFGPNNAPLITVIDGNAVIRAASNPFAPVGALPTDFLTRFFAFDPNYLGGVFVAAGDITGDGKAEIVVGTDSGTASTVRTFINILPAGVPFAQFLQLPGPLGLFHPYGAFPGGTRVAVGDTNGDGFSDIIVGSGPGALPNVQVYDGRFGTLLAIAAAQGKLPPDPNGTLAIYGLTQNYLAFNGLPFVGGIYVNAGDFDLDGKAEILVGTGIGSPPFIEIFRGDVPGFAIALFQAFDERLAFPNSPPGVAVNRGVSSVAFGGFDQATGTLDVLVATGRGEPTKVFIVQMGRLGKSPFYQPLLPPGFVSQFAIAFDPFNFGLGVLQDGAALGGVVSATGNS